MIQRSTWSADKVEFIYIWAIAPCVYACKINILKSKINIISDWIFIEYSIFNCNNPYYLFLSLFGIFFKHILTFADFNGCNKHLPSIEIENAYEISQLFGLFCF